MKKSMPAKKKKGGAPARKNVAPSQAFGNTFDLDVMKEAHDNVVNLRDDLHTKGIENELKMLNSEASDLSEKSAALSNVSKPSMSYGKKTMQAAPEKPALISIGSKKDPALQYTIVDRNAFFGKFYVNEIYPLDKLPEVIKSIEKSGPSKAVHLHLPGTEQLSDIVWRTMWQLKEKKPIMMVKCLNLTGCLNVTDRGLNYAAKLFPDLKELCLKGCAQLTEAGLYAIVSWCPGLKKLCLKGCAQVTEVGLYAIVSRCPGLKKVNIRGTSVAILPHQVVDMDITLDGYPVISPERDILDRQGLKIMNASLFKKPVDKDLMKLCVIQPSNATTSFVKYLNNSKEKAYRPMSTVSQFVLTDRFTTNVIECDVVVSDLFLSKRAMYVLTVADKENQKDGCKRIFSLMCHILNKVHHAAFVLVGFKSGFEATEVEAIKNSVAAMASNKSTAMKKTLTEEAKKFMKDGFKNDKSGRQEQDMFMKRLMLSKALRKVSIDCVQVDTSTPYKKDDTLSKCIATGMDKTCQLYPEMQELAAPMFKFVQSDSSLRSLKDGAVSMGGSKPSLCKTMELMETMGRAVCTTIIQESRIVCQVEWLARVINHALAPPPGAMKNENRVLGVARDVPLWLLEDLVKELEKVMPKEQANSAAALLTKLGFSINPSVFISYKELSETPPQSLDNYFPEIPPYDRKKDLFFTIGYKADLETPLPSLVLHKMMFLCSRTKRPSLMWDTGFILLDGCVETLFWLDTADNRSALYLYTHTVKKHQGGLEMGPLFEMVHNTALAYKVVFDYVLHEMCVPYRLSMVAGEKQEYARKTYSMVAKHMFKPILDEDDQPTSGIVCTVCNESPRSAALPWVLHDSLNKPYMDTFMFDILSEDNKVHRAGNVITFRNQGGASLRSMISPGSQTSFKVALLTEDACKLNMGLGYGYIPKKGYCSGGFLLNLETGKLDEMMPSLAGGKAESKLGAIPKEGLPKVGSTVTLQCLEMQDHNMMELKVYRDTEQVFSIQMPKKDYVPLLQSPKSGSDYSATVAVYPLYSMVDKEMTELQAGMRLEALDRKNPNLVCAATIQEVREDGQVLIHFDGWGTNYDYLTDPKSADLHPIGWMEKMANPSQTLQAPHRYHKRQFVWEEYCRDNNFLPVPFGWFTMDQIGGGKRDRYDSVMQELDISMLEAEFCTSCTQLKNRPKMLERKAMVKCLSPKDMFEFFTKHNKFFCLLPDPLSAVGLRNPSLQSIMDFSHQNVHILCAGIKTELLHFVDYKGTPLPSSFSVADLALYIQSCYIGLLVQDYVLPKDCSQMVPGIESLDDAQYEMCTQRLFFIYICILELHAAASKTKGNRVAMDLFTEVAKDKEASARFAEKDPSPLCKGHAGSFMANNELREIPLEQFNQFYHFMTKLDFQNNILESLPADFFQKFQHLESLNLANNRLEALPEGIGCLKDLTQLDLSGNKIKALPKDFTSVKEHLTSLNVSDNPLNGLPKFVFELVNLEELLAENVGVIADLAKIVNLKNLEVLNLGKNAIEDLPDGLGDLPLTSLDLSGVPWFPSNGQYQSFRAFMQALMANNVTATMTEKQMHELFVSSDVDESSSLTPNEIIDLNYNVLFPKYPRMGAGKMAYENGKSTGYPPPFIFRLYKLKKLVLRHHGLKRIPDEIANLHELTEVDFSFNPKLFDISAELGGCPVKQIKLQECIVLNTPPKEVVSRGVMSIMGYLKRLKLGASPCKRTKLMMVGLGGAGKTSLVNSLINARYRAYMDQDEPITDGIDITNLVNSLINARYRAYMDQDEPITDGIDITKWEIPIEKNDKLTFSVWDFAGQTVYYNTHQFFLSNRGVYLLLWNVRQGSEHAGLDFWLSSIACHAPKAPILLIGTHVDKVEKYHLPEQDIKDRYPQIAGFHYVSSYTGKNIPQLKEALIKLTLEQKYMGEKIPEAWLTLEKRLISHREEKSVDILPYKQVETISSSCGIFDKAELIQAVQFLHDLGAVQFFNKDFLRGMVVIYPQWIVDVMACIVTVHEGAVKDGRLLLRDVGSVWQAYPKDLHPWLLRLTEEFDLTCPLQDEEASIVPCLLPEEEPKYEWPHAQPQKNIHESMTVYRFQYLPAGLFNRAQVRLHQYSKGAKLWKKGSYMKKNGHICLMLQTKDQEVVVRAQGFRPDNFLFLVHEMIETLISESYTGVQYDFLIPCMDCLSMNVKDPSMVSHYKVQRALELNVPFLQCKKFFHILSIQELKDAMPSDKMSDMDNHLRNSVRELIDLDQEATISVFFVFTSKNQPSLSNADDVVHPGTVLEDLRKQNFKVSYTDKPQSSDMEALSLSMKAANVTMIGMSDEFCADPECKKLLLYVKDVLRRPVLLLLLGKTKNWQKSDINMSVSTEVYVDMTNKARYEHKIKELYDALKKKSAVKDKIKEDECPKCFISYCWTNSHDAISKGSRPQDGGLGWEGGDPRKVKDFLEEKGVKCWLDIEKVGGVGLFHSIADGLREAEVMVAFVSDQYAVSRNCVMEFRYALSTLRIPVILVVVGTGYMWERSEVGLLAVGNRCEKISLQYENTTGYLGILKFVKDHMSKEQESKDSGEDSDSQRNAAFQEVLELTQRKFLRHMYASIISDASVPYPGLVVVDFLKNSEKQELSKALRNEAIKREKTMIAEQSKIEEDKEKEEGGGDDGEKVPTDQELAGEEDEYQTKSKFCFRVMCENPEGWHMTESYIPFPEMDHSEQWQLIDNGSPYLGRVYAIAKHSNILLECLTTPEGEIFQQRVEEICVKSASDFKEEYDELRSAVMQEDKGGNKHNLHRCQVNGKMVWLCNTHKMASRSKTEKMYGGQLGEGSSSIPVPQDEAFIEATQEPEEVAPAPPTARAHRKVFKRSSTQKPQLKRQTSQACSVM